MTETRTRNRIEQDMEKTQRRYQQRIEDIRADQDLTHEAKKRRMQEVYEEARTHHGQLYDQQRQELRSRVERLRKEALGPPTMFGSDKALVALNYRDALSRVAGIDDDRQLAEVLGQAERTEDAALAKAALYRGFELGSERLLGEYFEAYPGDRPAWDAFMDASEEYNVLDKQNRMFGDMGPEQPRELGG